MAAVTGRTARVLLACLVALATGIVVYWVSTSPDDMLSSTMVITSGMSAVNGLGSIWPEITPALNHKQSVSQAVRRSPDTSGSKAEQCVPPGFRAVTVKNDGNPFSMAVLASKDIVSESVASTGKWEVSGFQEIASRSGVPLPSSGTFLDIGANLGYYTLLFAKQGYRTISVEPGTNNRRAINASLCMNPDIAGRVHLMPVALTDASEVGNMRCVLRSTNTQINLGNMWLKCATPDKVKACTHGEKACEEVPVKTLDSLLSELTPSSIDAVKIDVEEHECNILRGGETLFSTYAPKMVQVETMFGNAAECVKETAAKVKYTLKSVSQADTVMMPVS